MISMAYIPYPVNKGSNDSSWFSTITSCLYVIYQFLDDCALFPNIGVLIFKVNNVGTLTGENMKCGKPVMIFTPKFYHLHRRRLTDYLASDLLEFLGVPIIHERVLLIISTASVASRSSYWVPKHISLGGWIVLLNTVILALPVYLLSKYWYFYSVIIWLGRWPDFYMVSNYFGRKSHWLSWLRFCLAKSLG